ncbi:SAM-dependent methyltransferase [Streptomyces sp. NPDC007883]|uniref:SAM-dependent methyltransferase n=1 Tax=Streptomyces sp. NPDC007883 TaxID=3155116 RepID=UPI0033E67817
MTPVTRIEVLRDRVNTAQPHTARIWNYWPGGKDSYEIDRETGDQIRTLHPGIGDHALADRQFLGRAVSIPEHAARTLDLSRAVALVLLGVVIFIGDHEDPHGLVRRPTDALPPGSRLVLSHTITSPAMPDVDEAVSFGNEHGTPRLTQRTPADVTRFFDGLDLLEPGVVSCNHWRPDAADGPLPDEVAMYGGVGRKA